MSFRAHIEVRLAAGMTLLLGPFSNPPENLASQLSPQPNDCLVHSCESMQPEQVVSTTFGALPFPLNVLLS
jgi:hypothetical protein